MRVTRIPTITPTKSQREWLDKKRDESGETIATIIRQLIQEKINNGK